MKDKGFKQDDFPKQVFSEVKVIEKSYLAKIKSYQKSRKNLSQKMCFSIDSKGARAIDDALSIEKVEGQDRLWKVGIHIADVAEFVTKNKQIDKIA